MTGNGKRKAVSGGNTDSRDFKRKKGGSGGKWQTPHQKEKISSGERGKGVKIEPGDFGIWATCMKGKEGKATIELKSLFEEQCERIYGTSSIADDGESDPDAKESDAVDDIESMIQKEVSFMSNSGSKAKALFRPVWIDVPCLLFFKTQSPIDPVIFVRQICEDAARNPKGRKHRFLNRLTPVTLIGRATEKGIHDLAENVLGKHFSLTRNEPESEEVKEGSGVSYAIRPTIRSHNTLKRDELIKQIASLIGPKHKVNLSKPEMVILVEIYQNVCGMSVVTGDWEALKRFNLNEIYQPTNGASGVADIKNGASLDAIRTDDNKSGKEKQE